MSFFTRTSAAVAALFALTAAPAQATQFILHYEGMTASGGELPDTSAIAAGLAFTMDAVFDDATLQPIFTGYGVYNISTASVQLNGTTYALDPTVVSAYRVGLTDPTFPLYPGFYIAMFGQYGTGNYLGAGYSGVTNPLSGWVPAVTTYSSYQGTIAATPWLDVGLGQTLKLNVDGASPISASITAVPEPTNLALMLAGAAALGATARRRAKAQAQA